MCLCNLFARPPHLQYDQTFQSVYNVFSTCISRLRNDTEEINTSLVSEIGIVPTETLLNLVQSEDKSKGAPLSTCDAEVFTLRNRTDLHAMIKLSAVGKEILVYMDPAATPFAMSMHALAFVVRVILPGNKWQFVLIAFEEFDNTVSASKVDMQMVLAEVFVLTCASLQHIYDNYFTEVLLIPEANSMDLDMFWRLTANMYKQQNVLHKVKFRSTVISSQGTARQQARFQPYDSHKQVNYRIGYALKTDKVARICKFFSNCYNYHVKNESCFSVAKCVWNLFSNKATQESACEYVIRKLGQLRLKPTVSKNGHVTYTISGKGKHDNVVAHDDLAIATCMACSLMSDVYNNCFNHNLTTL